MMADSWCGLVARPDESGHAAGIAHDVPGLVGHLHLDQNVTRQQLVLHRAALIVLDFDGFLHRYADLDFFMLLSGFYCFVGLAADIVVDISYGFIDPRIRMGAR